MKKVYEKPMILFEDFTMCTNIAAGCEVINNNPTSGTCAYGENDFGEPIFTGDVKECVFIPSDGQWDGLCYHVPTGYGNLFNS